MYNRNYCISSSPYPVSIPASEIYYEYYFQNFAPKISATPLSVASVYNFRPYFYIGNGY
jgi:hypothetical protein